jgi:putative membrane protein
VRRSRLLLGALVGAQVLYPRVPAGRRAVATNGVLALMLATSVAEALEARGRRGAALLALAALTAHAVELVGVRTGRPFGRYAYSAKLGPRAAGVPLVVGAPWAAMARPAWVVAGLLDPRPGHRAALAAGALTAWDVFVDPRMVADGYWRWSRPGRYEEVPLSNFAGWMLCGGLVFAAWSALDPADDPRPGDGALALYVWTWAGETFANAAFFGRPRVALAGGVSMGAFALPALVARLRR